MMDGGMNLLLEMLIVDWRVAVFGMPYTGLTMIAGAPGGKPGRSLPEEVIRWRQPSVRP